MRSRKTKVRSQTSFLDSVCMSPRHYSKTNFLESVAQSFDPAAETNFLETVAQFLLRSQIPMG